MDYLVFQSLYSISVFMFLRPNKDAAAILNLCHPNLGFLTWEFPKLAQSCNS